MMTNDLHNKLADTQKNINSALETLKKAQASSMKNAEQLLSGYQGEHKEMLVQEMANIRKAMKTADAKDLNRISERMIELINKCR